MESLITLNQAGGHQGQEQQEKIVHGEYKIK